jgi:hypothetical protein
LFGVGTLKERFGIVVVFVCFFVGFLWVKSQHLLDADIKKYKI